MLGQHNDQLINGFYIAPGTHRLEMVQPNFAPLALDKE